MSSTVIACAAWVGSAGDHVSTHAGVVVRGLELFFVHNGFRELR